MNKGELIEAIANDASITKAQAQAALDAFVSNVQRSLKSDDKVTLTGFGTFSASTRVTSAYGKEPSNRSVHPDSGEKGSKILSGQGSQRRYLRSCPTTTSRSGSCIGSCHEAPPSVEPSSLSLTTETASQPK